MVPILIHFLLLAWLSWEGYKKFKDSPIRLYYFPALVLKIVAGIILGLLYFLYYGGGDTLNYHQDATALAILALDDPLAYLRVVAGGEPHQLSLIYVAEERALLTAKIFSFFYVLTAHNYWITASYISFLSFFCLFRLSHRLVKGRSYMQKSAALSFLFWPSFVFWTSGMLKESLAMICIAFIIAAVLPYILDNEKVNKWEVGIAIILFLLLWRLKYYYAGLLAPVLACLLLSIWLGRSYKLKEGWVWMAFIFFLAGGALLATQLHPNLNISRFLGVWVENYYLLAEASAEGGYVKYDQLQPSWRSILQNAPKAVAAGLYAPLVQVDLTNPLRMMATAENFLLLILTLWALGGWLLEKKGRLSLLVFAIIIYLLSFALVMGIAAPNFGTLSRYRISYQPFFVFLVLLGCQYLLSWWRWRRGTSS